MLEDAPQDPGLLVLDGLRRGDEVPQPGRLQVAHGEGDHPVVVPEDKVGAIARHAMRRGLGRSFCRGGCARKWDGLGTRQQKNKKLIQKTKNETKIKNETKMKKMEKIMRPAPPSLVI